MSDDKIINIQKLDPSEFHKEAMPYMMLPTKVVQVVSREHPMAAIIWVYLQSLPPTWTPNKFHLMSHFQISERTYQRYMSFLSDCNLVSYSRGRNKNGTLGAVRMIVHNGTNFKPALGSDHTAKIVVVDFHHTAISPLCGATTPVANGDHINNINTTKKKEENIKPSTHIEDYLVCFEKFYSVYPRKKGKQDAVKWFKKEKPSIEFVSMLIEDVNKRLATDWKGKEPQYLPYPATYLNGKRWEDGIDVPLAQQNHDKEQKERLMRESIAREENERKAKEQEKRDAPNIMKNLKVSMTERMAKQEAEMKRLGMNHHEYHEYITKNKEGMPKDNI